MDPEQPNGAKQSDQVGGGDPMPDYGASSVPGEHRQAVDNGIDVASVADLQALAVALHGTTVELTNGSEVFLTIDGVRGSLQSFDEVGDKFGGLLDSALDWRAKEREEYGVSSDVLPIDHKLTNPDIVRLFKSISPHSAQMEFSDSGSCEFEYGGSNEGPRWTIALVDEASSLKMKWTFDYSER